MQNGVSVRKWRPVGHRKPLEGSASNTNERCVAATDIVVKVMRITHPVVQMKQAIAVRDCDELGHFETGREHNRTQMITGLLGSRSANIKIAANDNTHHEVTQNGILACLKLGERHGGRMRDRHIEVQRKNEFKGVRFL